MIRGEAMLGNRSSQLFEANSFVYYLISTQHIKHMKHGSKTYTCFPININLAIGISNRHYGSFKRRLKARI